MLALHFGAGNTGRDFVGQLLHESGCDIVFVDVRDDVVEALKKEGCYEVILADEGDEHISVDHASALHSVRDADEVAESLADADLDTIHAEGERSTFARYAGIEPDHPLANLVIEAANPARK